MSGGRRRIVVVAVAAFAVAVALTSLAAMTAAPDGMEWQPYLARQFWLGAVLVPVGVFLVWQRPQHRLGWLFLVSGTTVWLTFSGQPLITWLMVHTTNERLARVVLASTIWGWLAARGIVYTLVPLCYPSPRPPGRAQRSLWVVAVVAIVTVAVAHAMVNTFEVMGGVEQPTGLGRVADLVEPWAWKVVLATSLAAVVSMAWRVVGLPTVERGRHLPFAITATLLMIPGVDSLWNEVFGRHVWERSEEVLFWTSMALPLVLTAGVLVHGLLDIGLVLRRSTVSLLTGGVLAALYVVVVWASSTVVTSGSDSGRLLATGLVAVCVVPVHVRVHGMVERRLFGRRDEPAAVLAAIGRTVEQAQAGERALDVVAATVRDELRLPFVAVEVEVQGRIRRVASCGESTTWTERFPLHTAEGTIGDLVAARRTPHEPFDRAETEALTDIARQVAVIASNVALTEQLQTSRRLLVEAREEERRRIRRDLHDGLGPTLASVCLGLGAAADRIGDDSDLGVLLKDLETELHQAVHDIRRLVYDLRPPALDELGLVGAVRDHVSHLAGRSSDAGMAMELTVEGPMPEPELPAAVEVAAYRIALEAVTNAARHADAEHCWVRIAATADEVCVEVEDDGCGIPDSHRAGIGLRSMRDRAAELGGRLSIGLRSPHGTVVHALLPVAGASP